MVKIKDIAEKLGVSQATVSNVLNNRKNVSDDIRAKVLEAVDEMGYIPKEKNYSNLLQGKKLIIFEYSAFQRDFYGKILKGIYNNTTENGVSMIVVPQEAKSLFMNPNFSNGSIILDSTATDEEIIELAKMGYPMVLMDREINQKNVISVISHNYPVMKQFVHELIRKGYKRFGFLKGLEKSLDNQERFQAFLDALEEAGLSCENQFIYSGDFTEASGYQIGKIMTIGEELPEILLCANDDMAIGVMQAFNEKNIKIPDDMAITGFDDIDNARISELTTLAIPRYESGYLASKILLQMISNEISTPKTLYIDPEIVWRKTTR